MKTMPAPRLAWWVNLGRVELQNEAHQRAVERVSEEAFRSAAKFKHEDRTESHRRGTRKVNAQRA